MQPPALRALLTINTVIYVAWVLVLVHIRSAGSFVVAHLALNPDLPGLLFEPWQVITYNFLHLGTGFWGLIHLLFNMLWLVWIGREYEEMQGSHRLLAIYLISGIGGALLTVAWYGLVPTSGMVYVYGASASVLGVLTAVAIFYPYKSVALFLIPFPIRLIHLVIAFLVLDLLLMAGSNTSITAHMGGALFGFLFARAERSGKDLSSWARWFFDRDRGSRRSRPTPRKSKKQPLWKRGEKSEAASASTARVTPLPRREVAAPTGAAASEIDRILDKISEQGYEALTAEEKRLLYEASKKD